MRFQVEREQSLTTSFLVLAVVQLKCVVLLLISPAAALMHKTAYIITHVEGFRICTVEKPLHQQALLN